MAAGTIVARASRDRSSRRPRSSGSQAATARLCTDRELLLLRWLLGGFDGGRQPALYPRGQIAVHHSGGCGLIDPFGGQAKFRFGHVHAASGDRFADFANLRFDRALGGSIAGPTNFVLTMTFLSA